MEHTNKKFKAIHIYSTKSEEASICIWANIFFLSSIILIFGVFIYTHSKILKVNLKWLRVPTADFTEKVKNHEGEYEIR